MADARVRQGRSTEELLGRIRRKEALVGVIGLGYVGLPLALSFSEAGMETVGFDTDDEKVARLKRGESYISHIPADRVARAVAGKAGLVATSDFSRLREVDAAIICVPTPLGKHREPDLSFVESTVRCLAETLRRGQLVVLESTTYPGTTREIVKPILEGTGLRCGSDFHLAFSPEREDPGRSDWGLSRIPKLVGGITPGCVAAAQALYDFVVERTVAVSSPEVAEAAKLLENIYRAVNIALVNELKVLFHRMGIEVWEVIAAAATKPFGFTAFYPGPGLGGHCVPIDPFYLAWRAREFGMSTKFVELAGEINAAMPEYVVQRLAAALNERGKSLMGARVLCLGVAYKANVDDTRESASLEVMKILLAGGAKVSYHDPYVPRLKRMRRHDLGLESVPLTPETLAASDAVLILTAHSAVGYAEVVKHAPLVVDTRNVARPAGEGGAVIVQA